MLEYWNDGILGYGEMVKWVTCREPLGLELGAERPQGRAIGKIHNDREVRMFINEKLPLKTNIPIFFAPASRCSVPPLRGGFPVSIVPLFRVRGKKNMPQ